MDSARVRAAEASDLPRLTEIYNHYVRETAITFDLEPFDVEERRAWFDGFSATGRHRLLVAERDGVVAGYACSHRFRPKGAYDRTVETTIYLARDSTGRGLGRRLYGELLEALSGTDAHLALAGMTLPNAASEALHRAFGFEPVGVYAEVGYKFDRYWDVAWFQKRL